MDDKIKINLHMAGEVFPVTIRRDDEEMVRAAAKEVTLLLGTYKGRFGEAVTERQLLTMVAYHFSLEYMREKERNDTLPYKVKIRELSDELEAYFRKES